MPIFGGKTCNQCHGTPQQEAENNQISTMKNTSTKPKRNTTDSVYKNENRTSQDLIVASSSIIIPNTHMLGGIFGSFPLTPEKTKLFPSMIIKIMF